MCYKKRRLTIRELCPVFIGNALSVAKRVIRSSWSLGSVSNESWSDIISQEWDQCRNTVSFQSGWGASPWRADDMIIIWLVSNHLWHHWTNQFESFGGEVSRFTWATHFYISESPSKRIYVEAINMAFWQWTMESGKPNRGAIGEDEDETATGVKKRFFYRLSSL